MLTRQGGVANNTILIVAALSFQAEQWARGLKGLDINESFMEEPAEKGYVNLRYGFAQMGKIEQGHVVPVKKAIIALESQIRHWKEYADLQKLYTEFQRLKSKLQDELAVIIYRRIVSGRCKYCPI